MTGADHYLQLPRPIFEGRKVIVCADVLQGAAAAVPVLQAVGSERPFLLAGSVGTGPVPADEEAERFVIGTTGDGVMGNIRAFEAALLDLPAAARDALDAYDPEREALVLGTFFTPDAVVSGRRVYGGRPSEWEALEDKTEIASVFEAAGIEHVSSAVARVADAGEAGRALDRGNGVAWAGDAREGWWGGAAYFRWVRDDADPEEAERFFGEHCDRVRVMPFLEGIPCSVHGAVFPQTVIAFRPVEMLTLRRKGTNQLHYAGVATFWDPPDADRDEMRDAARKLGATLRDLVGYRGIFTLDGVLTSDGFRPTELNPRPGAGLSPQMGASGVNLVLLNKLVIEGEPLDFRPADLEALVVSSADATRGGGCHTLYRGDREETTYVGVARRAGRYTVLPEGESGDGVLVFGPSNEGGFVRYQPDWTAVRRGPSFAPTAAEIFAFTDAEFGTGLGPLEAAPDVRR